MTGPRRRIPAHDLDAERSLLGAMMLSVDAIGDALQVVRAEDFYKPAYGHVFDSIHALYATGVPADAVTVADELRRAGLLDIVGGHQALVEIMASTPATTSAASYAAIVEHHALVRRLIAAGGEIAEMGYSASDDLAQLLDRAESTIYQVAQRRLTDTTDNLSNLLSHTLDRLEERAQDPRKITGTPTGYDDLDEQLAGLQPSSLVVVGARPAMGKTSFALGMAAHAAARAGRPVLYASLEMSSDELSQRLLCSEAGVDSTRARTGQLSETDWHRISRAVGKLASAPLWIDDNPSLTVTELRAKARRLRTQHGDLGLVVIDYLQLMNGRPGAENRQVAVAEISRSLKVLARELECPVVALSQLTRTLEQRIDKRPVLADLRESGSLEQDADVVAFIYRDEMYHPDTPDRGTAEVIVAKHRAGPTGTVRLAATPAVGCRFGNLSRAA